MSKLRCRLIATLLVIGTCLALLAGCPGRRQVQPPRTHPTTSTQPPDDKGAKGTYTIQGPYTIVYPVQGPRVFMAKVQSGQGISAEGHETLTLTGVDCQMYQAGIPTLNTTADTAKAMFKGKTVYVKLTGNVHAKEPKQGLLLDAETLNWASDAAKLTATRVRWRGNGYEHRADTARFTTDLSEGTFSGNVRTDSAGSGR